MPIEAVAAAAPIAGGLLGGLVGGGPQTGVAIPPDLQGPRAQQIALLQYLLGYNPASAGGGGVARGGGTSDFQIGRGDIGGLSRQGTGWPGTDGGGGSLLPQFGDPTQRLESFFGPLTSPLQRQATDYLSNFVNQQNPAQRTLDALTPMFERNLATANQEGARFSSGNAILRSRAVEDYNLLGAQADLQARQQQQQAAQLLGMFGQSDVNTRLGILQNLLGTAQSATLGLPLTQTPGGFQQGAELGGQWAQLYTLLKGLG